MIVQGKTLREGDQIIYRGYVAMYEGDLMGTFALAHEDSFENVISFPSSVEEIIEQVDEECGSIVFDDTIEVVTF